MEYSHNVFFLDMFIFIRYELSILRKAIASKMDFKLLYNKKINSTTQIYNRTKQNSMLGPV